MPTLYPDVYFSRRLRLHHVCDDAGEVIWSGKHIVRALEYLLQNGNHHFILDGGEDGDRYKVEVHLT